MGDFCRLQHFVVVVVWDYGRRPKGPFGLIWLVMSKTVTLWVRSNIIVACVIIRPLWSDWFGSYGASRDPRGLGCDHNTCGLILTRVDLVNQPVNVILYLVVLYTWRISILLISLFWFHGYFELEVVHGLVILIMELC